MPIYEFQCPPCDVRFEALMPTGTGVNVCPECSGEAVKVYSSFSARTVSKSKVLTKKDARKKKHDV